MELDHQCGNNACSCKVKSEGDCCGDSCREKAKSANQAPDSCNCQHADCDAAQSGN